MVRNFVFSHLLAFFVKSSLLITIKLHYGGEFTKLPDVNYIHGTVMYADMVDI